MKHQLQSSTISLNSKFQLKTSTLSLNSKFQLKTSTKLELQIFSLKLKHQTSNLNVKCLPQTRDEQNENWSTTTTTQSTCEERPQPQLDLITHNNNNINPIFTNLLEIVILRHFCTSRNFFDNENSEPAFIFYILTLSVLGY